jgi:hypothetical protein
MLNSIKRQKLVGHNGDENLLLLLIFDKGWDER